MPGSDVPVIRQPFVAGDALPFWAASRFTGNHLWDVDDDPGETHDLAGDRGASARPSTASAPPLDEVDAPDDQFARLGVA